MRKDRGVSGKLDLNRCAGPGTCVLVTSPSTFPGGFKV